MSQDQIELLQRALEREKKARKAAEKILEEKSRELYLTSNRLESLLDEKSSQLQGVFENIIDAFVVMNIKGDILKFNDAATRLFGYDVSRESINVSNLVHKDDLQYAMLSFEELRTKGFFKNYEARVYTKSKEIKWVHINASLVFDKNNKPVAAQGIVRDITQERLLKQEFKDQKNQLSIIINNSPIGISLTKADYSGILQINQALIDMLGYTAEELMSMKVQDITHPDDEEFSKELRDQLLNGKIDKFNVEKKYIKKDGNIFWAKTNVTAVRNKVGEIDYQVVTIEDVSKEREAKEKLIESENRLATLVLNLDSGIILEDENRKVVLTNNKFCELLNINIPIQDLYGMDCSIAAEQNKVLFKDPEAFVQRMNDIDEAEVEVIGDELEMLDGKILERNYLPIIIGEKSKGFLWTFTDVTLKRSYSKSLEAQKQKYYSIIANMNLGLVEVNNKEEILMVNQSFSEMSGYAEDELIGKHAGKIFKTREAIDIIAIESDKRKKGESNSYEVKVEIKNGDIRYWLISGAPNYDINGHVVGSIGVHIDITDLKNLELQKEKLLSKLEKSNDELQEYAHIVSHDLKSPLRSIDALVSWLKEDNKGKLDEMSLRNFNLIETTLEKMEQLISDVLDYSSIGTERNSSVEVDLNKMLDDLITILYVPEHISIKVLNKLPAIKGDATKLQQLFQNLISNAIKFIDKEKGFITINVEDFKSHYKFSIQDNGMGIDKQFHDKIFKIFHALNKSKDSTGIGLSIVKKIVDLHEGQIWLDSQLNVGTTFYFTLKK
ncbi:PAS domain S-box protein [Winogradskyella undariae]|uniref:PAS domain-containing sensor histidine kinase n=1 Tax=Winogradskyella undariae TaxID=1285465 RepID=UPI00156B5C65|nr:PAS domain-containing sensor histidine kinase [Winogradskyella undariae]NRR90098.1 PAS domain S-box protein [Winogradskyella undariae]QNK76546.1 PAS domain S-box protein [Winogradskyella sp. PAMC22761]